MQKAIKFVRPPEAALSHLSLSSNPFIVMIPQPLSLQVFTIKYKSKLQYTYFSLSLSLALPPVPCLCLFFAFPVYVKLLQHLSRGAESFVSQIPIYCTTAPYLSPSLPPLTRNHYCFPLFLPYTTHLTQYHSETLGSFLWSSKERSLSIFAFFLIPPFVFDHSPFVTLRYIQT